MSYKWQLYHEASVLLCQPNLGAITDYNNLIQRYGDTPDFHYGLAEFLFHMKSIALGIRDERA